MQTKGATKDLYGPNNPPPLPDASPPNGSRRDIAEKDMSGQRNGRNRPGPDKRRRTYAEAEAKESYARDPGRFRSRSPARHLHHQYRKRSPLRDEKATKWPAPRSQASQTTCNKDENMRCYACNETGHETTNCKGASGGYSSYGARACFRCGEIDHIARECKDGVGQIKSDAEVAAINYRHLQQSTKAERRCSWSAVHEQSVVYDWERGVGGNRWVPAQKASNDYNRNEALEDSRQSCRSPHDIGASNDRFDQYRYARGNAGQHLSRAASSSARAMEHEVDWDNEALDAGGAAHSKTYKTPQKLQRAGRSSVLKQSQGPRSYPPDGDRRRRPITKENAAGKQMTQVREEGIRSQESRPKSTKKDLWPSQENGISAPLTAYDLRGYDYRIYTRYADLSKPERFVNGGNGKVAPAIYGSEQRHDLGLCFATFLTKYRCEMGLHCPWRHHPLSAAERAWITRCGRDRGREFLHNIDRWWAFPEMPVPAATMQGLGDD